MYKQQALSQGACKSAKGETYADEISYQHRNSVFAPWNHCSCLCPAAPTQRREEVWAARGKTGTATQG
jgi:hypothetical protein